jgi:hypothetical protein
VINFLHEDTKELHKAGKLWDNFLYMRNLANPKRHLNVFMTAEGARCASASRECRDGGRNRCSCSSSKSLLQWRRAIGVCVGAVQPGGRCEP